MNVITQETKRGDKKKTKGKRFAITCCVCPSFKVEKQFSPSHNRKPPQ